MARLAGRTRNRLAGKARRMKCQEPDCNRDATVHWTEIVGKEKIEKHLCAECAKAQSVPVQQSVSLAGFLQQLLQQKAAEALPDGVKTACPTCGMSYIEFRASGRLGCPNDYDVFREGVLPVLERMQDGLRHCGKTPARAGRELRHQNEMIRLRRELERAVQREEYEKAAEIRDRIESLDKGKAGRD